ncbi:MAG: FAD-dependent oxidoreductase, partial [Chloroflexota bacterium]
MVVGAGLAGLSAGLELKARGHEVHLIERSRLLGGKATSFELGGVEVDNGQHVFLACCTEFIDFVTQAVAGADGAIHSPGSCLYLQDRFDALLLAPGRAPARLRATSLSAPLHLAAALLRYRYLTLAERFRVGVALSRAERPINTHETFDAWLRRHGQNDNAFTAFWNPFFVPALNAPLDEVSAESALFVIRTAFLHDAGAARFGYSTVPLARIAGAAAAQLDA